MRCQKWTTIVKWLILEHGLIIKIWIVEAAMINEQKLKIFCAVMQGVLSTPRELKLRGENVLSSEDLCAAAKEITDLAFAELHDEPETEVKSTMEQCKLCGGAPKYEGFLRNRKALYTCASDGCVMNDIQISQDEWSCLMGGSDER